MTNNLFNSVYPIVAMSMNQVSDAKFAVGCAEAGLFPSIYNYTSYDDLVNSINYFRHQRGNTDFILTLSHAQIDDKVLIKILLAAQVRLIEVIMPWGEYDEPKFIEDVAALQQQGIRLIMRCLAYDKAGKYNGRMIKYFDAVLLKGNKGGGAKLTQSIEELFFLVKNDFPAKKLIVAGGISTREQVQSFLEFGAEAVGIGTLFAASQESKLSQQTKYQMVASDFDTVKQNSYANKNALVFKPIYTSDQNHTASLKLGIVRPDLGGHVYCGAGVNHVTAIRPLKDIVADLV